MIKSIQNHSLLLTKVNTFLRNANSLNEIQNVCRRVHNKRSYCRVSSPLLQAGPIDYGYTNQDPRFENKFPTIEYAKLMPNRYSAMRHEQILQLCVEGSYDGKRKERNEILVFLLIRIIHILPPTNDLTNIFATLFTPILLILL